MIISLFCEYHCRETIARHLKRALLMISIPVEFIITSIYWPLLLFLPHLILPPTDVSPTASSAPSSLRLPLQVALALHASPLLTVLVDFFAFEPKFPKIYVHTAAPAAILAFTVWYASFVEYCATLSGAFPYPFLTYSPFAVRVMIYTAAAGISLGCFRTLNALHA
ncbi:FAR-17a/AIG1-like protein [Boletus edulis]|nr:FAR-17a/AIG1-like protein [Boletus edulis]